MATASNPRQVIKVLAAAFLATPVIFVTVFTLVRPPAGQGAAVPDFLRYVLLGLGSALIVAAPVVQGIVRGARSGATSEPTPAALLTSFIVGSALREAAALLGGLIILLTGDVTLGAALALAAFFAMLSAFPTDARIDGWLGKSVGRIDLAALRAQGKR